MPHSSLAIANEFIRRGLSQNGSGALTQMQVQKLVYLAHAWTLASLEEPLIEDPVEAWKFGPVIRKLYSALSRYGRDKITREICWGEDTPFYRGDDGDVAQEELTPFEESVVDLIWETYGGYPAFKLSALTHEPDSPWSQTYDESSNRIIPESLIKEYFKEKLAA